MSDHYVFNENGEFITCIVQDIADAEHGDHDDWDAFLGTIDWRLRNRFPEDADKQPYEIDAIFYVFVGDDRADGIRYMFEITAFETFTVTVFCKTSIAGLKLIRDWIYPLTRQQP